MAGIGIASTAWGPSLRIYLNDVLTTDYVDTVDREGYLAVQHHGEKGQIYRFRNLAHSRADRPRGFDREA